MHSNAQMEFLRKCYIFIFKKMCRATTVPDSIMWISPRYYVNILCMGNPLIPDAKKHIAVLLLGEFKNRYVKAHINL